MRLFSPLGVGVDQDSEVTERMTPEEMTPEQVEETKQHALEATRQNLPCPNCGSNDEPVLVKPKRGTADWWDDPSVYVGCFSCGRYLQDLPSVYPYIWQAEREFD